MISMMIYGISILFSPGPVTLIALNKGLHKGFFHSFGYFLSIGLATYVLILVYSLTGQALITPTFLSLLTVIGCLYLLYLSYKMFTHPVEIQAQTPQKTFGFKEGFSLQLLNPKATIAALPIATIQYPLAHIEGLMLPLVTLFFLLLGTLSPALYCFIGHFFSGLVTTPKALQAFNKVMALMLVLVSLVMFYQGILDHQ